MLQLRMNASVLQREEQKAKKNLGLWWKGQATKRILEIAYLWRFVMWEK